VERLEMEKKFEAVREVGGGWRGKWRGLRQIERLKVGGEVEGRRGWRG